MVIIIKIMLIGLFIVIGFQDIIERQAYWFLFPLIGIFCGILFYNDTLPELFLSAISMNILFVSMLMLIVFLYSRLKLKISFFDAMGLGDILLFLGLSFAFSTVSFIILFVSAMIFSLALHLLLNKKSTFKTIPLAGYMSLFFSITYIAYWSGLINGLYII